MGQVPDIQSHIVLRRASLRGCATVDWPATCSANSVMQQFPEPLALELYRRLRRGEGIERLSSGLDIPVARLRQRLEAAAAYWERLEAADPAAVIRASLVALGEGIRT